jgi:hypothetical protein
MCIVSQISFQGACEEELLKGENFLLGKCKIRFIFLDPLLYFDPKHLFHNISVIKEHKCILSGQLGNAVATLKLLFALVPKKINKTQVIMDHIKTV